MKNTIAVLLFLCILSALPAQDGSQHIIDSLRSVLSQAKDDSAKVHVLIELSRQLIYANPEQGILYGREALDLATQLRREKDRAGANSTIGSCYVNKGDYANGLKYEYLALGIYDSLGDSAKQAVMLRNIGIAHHRSKHPDDAMRYDRMSLAIYESLHDTDGMAALYSNMANVYRRMNKPDSVLICHHQALDLYNAVGDPYGAARVIGNLANYYADEGEFPKAMVYYNDALRRETALDNDDGISRNLGNMGETYFEIARDTTGNIPSDSLIPAGRDANLRKGIYYLELAVNQTRAKQQADYFLEYSEALSDAYLLVGRTADALSLYREFTHVKDSVYDIDKFNAINNTRLNFEYGKREDSLKYEQAILDVKFENEKTSRRRDLTFYIIGSVIGLFFTAYVINRWKLTQKQKKIIEIERNRSEELLHNILPEETAAELKEKGKSDARLIDHVTVLFTDFKGFTKYAEMLSPHDLVAQINECFSEFDRIIERHGIEKIKTIGDAYMAAGGLPVPNTTHAVDVVSAALEIRDFMNRWLAEKKSRSEHFFEIRIGVHTGPVVAGIVGIKKFQYDIWGDTVNTASRMESSGEAGKVNISAATYELVKERFKCTPRGLVGAKNKGEMEMYFVE